MGWLGLIKLVLSISEYLTKYAHDRQLLKAGEYKAIAEHNQRIIENVNKASEAYSRAKLDESISSRLSKRYDLDNSE